MRNNRLLLILCLLCFSFTCLSSYGQENDLGLWASVDVSKKIDKRWSIGLEGEYRFIKNLSTTDRWSFGLSTDYKITKGLKANAGYIFMHCYSPGSYMEEENEDYEIEKTSAESYWYNRHRLFASVTGTIKAGNWRFSLRERWQYTYRPKATYMKTWAVDNDTPEVYEKAKEGMAQHILRSRVGIDYPIKSIGLVPYVSCELFTSKRIEKTNYSAGLEYDFNTQNSIKLYYIYKNNADEDENSGSVIGITYKYDF